MNVLKVHFGSSNIAKHVSSGNVSCLVDNLELGVFMFAIGSVQIDFTLGVTIMIRVDQNVPGLKSDIFGGFISVGRVRLEWD